MGKRRIVVIGAGDVGSSITYALMLKELAEEIVLLDINDEKAAAEVADIRHGLAGISSTVVRRGSYADCTDADLIVITAGMHRIPSQTRMDLLYANQKIMSSITAALNKETIRCPVVVVSNPVDPLVDLCAAQLALPKTMVFGTGCTLDSSRLVAQIAAYTGTVPEDVCGFVIGEHGEGQSVLWESVTVKGMAVADYCAQQGFAWTEEIRTEIAERVKGMGAKIIRGKGRTHYGIASCLCVLAKAILHGEEALLSVSTVFHENGKATSSPMTVGKGGIVLR